MRKDLSYPRDGSAFLIKQKLTRLKRVILKYGSGVVAFSGGSDSALLLKIASLVLPKNKILAVTASSEIHPKNELLFSRDIAKGFGVRHKIVKTSELEDKKFVLNSLNRCYYCKKRLFTKLRDIASEFQLNAVMEASSLSDELDFRPGNLARRELKIRSPLIEAGFTKDDVRRISRKLELKTWDKPSLPCLASRIAYGVAITAPLLRGIDKAEIFLRGTGLRQVRLRHHNNGFCRIEVLKDDIPLFITKRKQIVDRLKKIGYNYITLDLEGYRSGSFLKG